jgi:hypothetical protein
MGRPGLLVDLLDGRASGAMPVRGWWQQSEAVNAVVEDHAARNAEKLARSGKSERHLFVLMTLARRRPGVRY